VFLWQDWFYCTYAGASDTDLLSERWDHYSAEQDPWLLQSYLKCRSNQRATLPSPFEVSTAEGARTSLFVPGTRKLYLAVPDYGTQLAYVRVYEAARGGF
jgi:hypothetical protein